jgi:biopolymer transport protein ExbD
MIEFEKFEQSMSRESGPDLTPMIDMVFLLLIFFLLTSFLARPTIPVTLPEAETVQIEEKPELTITVLRNGELLLGGEEVTDERLERTLKRMLAFRQTREVVIQSDRDVPFGRIIEVMDLAKKSGAGTLSFLVEKKQ